MAAACGRAGRDPASVKLVAVTKGHDAGEIERAVLSKGCRTLGESRIQEWREKASALLEQRPEWHFIGNLQRNKVRYCREFHTIHSLNSLRLADELQAHGLRFGHTFRVLVEVNVASEESKLGASLDQAEILVDHARVLPNLDVAGLMTIAPHVEDPESVRAVFGGLRNLRDKLGLVELSMGMSSDFEVAIEEGATIVRIGSALFEGGNG
jgi:pyridoxal phosphate enzyme (YggS family)